MSSEPPDNAENDSDSEEVSTLALSRTADGGPPGDHAASKPATVSPRSAPLFEPTEVGLGPDTNPETENRDGGDRVTAHVAADDLPSAEAETSALGAEENIGFGDASDTDASDASTDVFNRAGGEDTAIRPPDDGPHPAERPDQAYAFARFDEDEVDDATSVDAAHEVAEAPTAILNELPSQPYLECTRGKDRGKDFTLQTGETSIGRGIDNEVILTDVAVSRRHVTLTWDGSSVRIRDLGSGNGTRVNGARVFECALNHGDTITCGETDLRLGLPEEFRSGVQTQMQAGLALPPVGHSDAVNTEKTTVALHWAPPWLAHGWRFRTVFVPPIVALSITMLAGVLVIGALVSAVTRLGASGADEQELSLAEQAFRKGMAQYERREWDEAVESFRAAQNQSHPSAPLMLERVRDRKREKSELDAARMAMEMEDYIEAISRAQSLPPASVYHGEAASIMEEARAHRQVSAWIAQARVAAQEGDSMAARQHLDEAASLGVDSSKVAATRRELDLAGAAAEPDRKPRSSKQNERTGTRSGSVERRSPARSRNEQSPKRLGNTQAVLSLYRAGNFAAASERARDMAGGNSRSELGKLGIRIDQFARAREKARTSRGTAALESLQTAVRLDRKISNGFYARKLAGELIDAYVKEAEEELSRGNAKRACTHVRKAQRQNAKSPKIRSLATRCVGEASKLISRAKSADPREARALLTDAMSMVPPSSSEYRAANARLNELSRAVLRDEDE